MRSIEAEINARRNEADRRTEIPITNFRGIELRDFPAEIARLALIIAEYQCDVTYRGQKEALAGFLPLNARNWITCGNALRLDWLSICQPTGTGVKFRADDLFHSPLDQAQIDFENEGGETYICGNPPYKGGTEQNAEQKADMASVFASVSNTWKSLDYIAGWFFKSAEYARYTEAACAFVSTNSICQGEQVARLWPILFSMGQTISFAHTSFKWANLAAHNAGVTVIIVGLSPRTNRPPQIFGTDQDGVSISRVVQHINAYLISGNGVIVKPETHPVSDLPEMLNGNKAVDGGHLVFDADVRRQIIERDQFCEKFVRPYFGSADFIKGHARYCIWITDANLHDASKLSAIEERLAKVRDFRADSKKELTRRGAQTPHLFQQIRQTGKEKAFVIPRVSSERRPYIPVGLLPIKSILADSAFGMFDAPIWCLPLMVSRLHLVWIATVCGKQKNRF